MKARLPAFCCTAALMLALLPHARATSFAVLLASGIEGESTDPAFPGGIDLLALGVDTPVRPRTPGSLSVHKSIDKASPLLARACAKGEHIKEAKLTLRVSPVGEGSAPVVCVVTMSDVLITSYQSSATNPDQRPTETMSLRFGRAFFQFFATDGGAPEVSTQSVALDTLDSDGDAMSDAWEEYYGLDAQRSNANEDSDGDGLTNLQEQQLGTNPVSGSSRFSAVATPRPDNPTEIEIAWDAVPGNRYVIEWTPDLGQPFTPLGGEVTADSSTMKARVERSGPTGFFRVRPASP